MEIGAGLISDQQLEIEITSGPFRVSFTTENVTSDNPAYDLWLSKEIRFSFILKLDRRVLMVM